MVDNGPKPGPELVTLRPETTAVVRGVVPTTELASFFDRSFRTLADGLAAQQVSITSPAFGLYRGAPGETADLEVGFVTEPAVEPDGDMSASSLPGGRVVRAVHAGGFDALAESWQGLHAWILEQGLTPGPVMWEVYVTKPSPEMNPEDLRTELNWPVSQG